MASEVDLTRPIIGIENRTAQEAFDIMADRIRSHLAERVQSVNSDPLPATAYATPFEADVHYAGEQLVGSVEAREVRDRLLSLAASGWYEPGKSYPVLSVTENDWINEVRRLIPLALATRPSTASEVEAMREAAAKVVEDYDTYSGDPHCDAVRDVMAVECAERIRALSGQESRS